MVSINYQGRFGNNLFQYFTALILSNKFNQKISNVLSNNILKHNLINNDINYNKNLIVDDNNINDILKLDTIDSNLILNGFFQNKDLLKHFNKNQNIINNNKELIKGTFVHVRLGDIVNDSRSCKIQYYKKALQGLNGGCISSDSPNNDIIKKLSDEFNLEIFESSPEETIIFGSQFDNKILSLGTFSWWIGFLGNQNNVICPIQKEYREWHGDIFPFLNWKEVSIEN
jgi:hypothetical protein